MITLLKVILAIIAINRFSQAISYFSGRVDPEVEKVALSSIRSKMPEWMTKEDGEKLMKSTFTITYIVLGLVSLFLIYAIFFII